MNTKKTSNNKIHPQKFALWIAIGTIIMMFAGFTSGFIVRKSQGDWNEQGLPWAFYASTLVIIISSITIHLALKTFKKRKMIAHKRLVAVTLLLGIIFTTLQYFGFRELFTEIQWQNNISFQFLFVIVLIHALHILGGVVAMIILFLKTFSKKIKVYSSLSIELIATYWHFVDLLWVYLFVFFLFQL